MTIADIERARAVIPIASVQNRYNVADRTWEDVVDYCEREGIAFIPWYPLGGRASPSVAKATRVMYEDAARRPG